MGDESPRSTEVASPRGGLPSQRTDRFANKPARSAPSALSLSVAAGAVQPPRQEAPSFGAMELLSRRQGFGCGVDTTSPAQAPVTSSGVCGARAGSSYVPYHQFNGNLPPGLQKPTAPPLPDGVSWAPGWSGEVSAAAIISEAHVRHLSELRVRERRDRMAAARQLVAVTPRSCAERCVDDPTCDSSRLAHKLLAHYLGWCHGWLVSCRTCV